MAEGFEYVASIKDNISGPSKDIKAALSAVASQIKSTSKEILELQKIQQLNKRAGFKEDVKESARQIADARLKLKELSLAHKDLRDAGKHSGGALEELKHHLFGTVTVGTLAAHAIEKVAETAKEAAVELGELVIKGFEFAIEAREFKEQMTEGFELFLGSKEAGEETFEEVQKIATALHAPVEQVGGLTNELLIAGLDNQKQLTETVQSITALQRVAGDAAAGKLENIVRRSVAAGKFAVTPKMLTGTGATLDSLSKIIGTKLHVSNETAKAMLKAGKVNVETGIDAINEAIEGGKIGERAKGMFKLKDIAVDFRNSMMKLFAGIDTAPFINALRQVSVLFDENTASGKMFRTIVLGAFNALFKIAGKATKALLLGFIYAQVYIVKAANTVPWLVKWLYKLYDAKTVLTIIKVGLIAIAAAAALVIGPFLIMAGIGALLISTIVAAVKFIASIDFKGIGLSIVNGIADGIKAGVNTVVDAAKGAAKSAYNAVKEGLGIHSPSKEMAKLGMYTSEGFAQGVEGGASKTHKAMSFATTPPGGAAAAGGGGRQITVNVGGIEIHGVQGAEQMAPMFETMFTDLLERVAIEVGG